MLLIQYNIVLVIMIIIYIKKYTKYIDVWKGKKIKIGKQKKKSKSEVKKNQNWKEKKNCFNVSLPGRPRFKFEKNIYTKYIDERGKKITRSEKNK